MAVTNIGEANIVIRAVTAGFKEDVEKALKDIKPVTKRMGEDVGKEFSKSVSRGVGSGGRSPFARLEKEADAARKTFNKLIKTGYFLGPAISGAVSAIGDLVLGLFAVGSAVGAAAPALAVLPGLLAAIAQGALTAKLAFGGVAKGIGALLKQKTGSAAGGGANNDAAIADARRRLAQVYQQAAEKMAAANDKVRKAQVALNQAYEEGAESLQQLGFDAEDAAIAQQKAAIELERARETLLRSQDLPADSRMRREAELAFKQADLDYRQATDRSNDLAKAQEYAAQTGIEGTKEVQSAKENLAEAEADLYKTQRDNAQDILEAQLALQRALQKTNQNSASSVDLLKDLSAEARRFALYIADLKPEFLKLRAAAGEKLFGPLTVAVDMLVTKLFPVLKPMLTEMGGVIGNIARKFAEMLTRIDNLDIIKRVFGGANIEIMRNLGDAFVDIAEGALNLLDAVAPLTLQFSEFIKKSADALVGTIRFKNATGELTASFERAAEFAKSIGGLLSSAFGAFKSLGAGASDSGKKIIDAFAGAFDKLKAFADEGRRTGELQEKFNAIADNVIAIGGFLGEVMKMFYQISGNQGVKAFFDAIKPIPGIFADIFNKMTSTGPVFGEFLVNIALLLKAFTETGGIQLFFDILNKATSVLVSVFSNEIVQKVFLFLAAVKGITLAFGVLLVLSKFTFKVLLGNLLALGTTSIFTSVGIGKLTKSINTKIAAMMRAQATAVPYRASIRALSISLRQLAASYLAVLAPLLPFIALAAVSAAAFYLLYKNSADLRKAVSDLGKALKGAFLESWKVIKDALVRLIPIFGNTKASFKSLGDGLAKVINFVTPLFTGAIKLIANIITNLIGVFQIIVNVIRLVIATVYAIGAAFISVFTGSEKIMESARGAIIGALNGIVNGINTLISAFNLLSPKDIPLVPFFEDAKKATDELKKSTDPLTAAQEQASKKMAETAASANNLYKEFGSLKEIQATVRTEIENTFDKVTGGARALINARDAAKAFKEETDKLNTTLKDGSLSVGQKEDSLYAYGASVLDAIKKDIELGGTLESTSKIMEGGRKAFLDGASAIGMSATEAQRLADKLGLTPATIKKTFEVSGLKSLQELTNQLAELEQLTSASRSSILGKTGEFKDIRKQVIEIKAKVDQQMTMKFGKRNGQDASSALYVNVTGKALGGPVNNRQGYLVGEKGPELFKPDTSGTIIPNNKLSAGGAGPTIIVNPSQGMDEVELAHNVSRQLAWSMRRGV